MSLLPLAFTDAPWQGAPVKTAAPIEFIERDGFAFVASDAEVQFRAKSVKPQNKVASSSSISPPSAAAEIDADSTLSFSAFAPDAKPPAFQEAKLASRSACADLQAASQSLSEVLKQVDAVLSQSAASPTASVAQATLPSPSLRRVSVSNIVSTFEQNKISPPVVVPARDVKRASFPPPSQVKEAEPDCLVTAKEQPEVAQQPSSPNDWTIVNSAAQVAVYQAPFSAEDAGTASIEQEDGTAVAGLPATPVAAELQAAATPGHSTMISPPSNQIFASEIMPLHDSGKATSACEVSFPNCIPATRTTPPPQAALAATAVAQLEPAVRVQIPAILPNTAVAVAAPVTAAAPPAVARYTFEDVERITTFAKEELQRRADAEVSALTSQLALKASQVQTLSDENTVLKDTLQQ